MQILISFILALAPAHAEMAVSECAFEDNTAVTIVLDRMEDRRDLAASTLIWMGEEIPSMPAGCVYQDVPGQRGFRCAHQKGDTRFDVYPRFNAVGGPGDTMKVSKAYVMIWENGRSPRSVKSTSCL